MKRLTSMLVAALFALVGVKAIAGLDMPPMQMTGANVIAALGYTPTPSKVIFSCSSQQPGNIVTNTASEVAFSFQSSCVIPANLLQAGDFIEVEQDGVYRADVAQSVQPWVRMGPAATSLTSRTILLTTGGAVSGLLNASTDTPWSASTRHMVQSNGTSMVSGGRLFFSTGATAALTALVASPTAVSFDRTVDNTLTASAAWTNGSTLNQIRAVAWSAKVIRP